MLVKFWGVHGSLPRPGPKTLKYGGNTPCVELRCGNTLIILDAGSGIRELGEDLLKRHINPSGGRTKIHGHIFISHLHWDHILGLPFFAPAFFPENEFDLYGVQDLDHSVRKTLENQMAEPNFPMTVEDLDATLRFHNVNPGDTLRVDGNVFIRVEELAHPGGSYGYRIEHEGKSVIYASDTEHVGEQTQTLLELSRDGDVLIYDSMFAPEQYLGLWDGINRESWGHSTWLAAVELAIAANVRELILFHHGNEDKIVEEMETKAREKFPRTRAAYEGLEIEL
jgi:phosphoribosyl 1,2-cyclic phosphodiesterase